MDTFETGCDRIDVTSLHRPDETWRHVDAAGHEHRWYVGGMIGVRYDPTAKYNTPTLIWVKDGEAFWPGDDEPHDVGHLECRQCGEHVQPGYKADDTRVYVPGLKWCRINGEDVSPEEFERRFLEAKARGEV